MHSILSVTQPLHKVVMVPKSWKREYLPFNRNKENTAGVHLEIHLLQNFSHAVNTHAVLGFSTVLGLLSCMRQ